jgi:hypothetical protein
LVLAPFAFGFLISNSTYRFRPKGAPSREFHAAEIWMSCGLVSRVFFTEASILARKQSGDVHYVEFVLQGHIRFELDLLPESWTSLRGSRSAGDAVVGAF